jgi:predicted O-linked N-acetylglucosamine transferase (SPINDLY family)
MNTPFLASQAVIELENDYTKAMQALSDLLRAVKRQQRYAQDHPEINHALLLLRRNECEANLAKALANADALF